MSSIRQILRLYAQGVGKKRISALSGTSRNTVKKYLHKFISLKLTYAYIDALSDYALDLLFIDPPAPPRDERYEQFQTLLPELEKQLKRKGVTRLQLWEAYRLENPQGYGRSRFNQHLQHYIGRTHPINLWLHRHSMGPIEQLWRRMTYGKALSKPNSSQVDDGVLVYPTVTSSPGV